MFSTEQVRYLLDAVQFRLSDITQAINNFKQQNVEIPIRYLEDAERLRHLENVLGAMLD